MAFPGKYNVGVYKMLRHDCTHTITMPVAASGASDRWKSWVLVGVNLLVADVARVLNSLITWQRRKNWRASLRDLDGRLLRDIGMTREQALLESKKPFWRD